MDKGLVSIITPCYNGAKYVAETIESVINQTYEKWEMIIVDDGSKDKSAEIIKTYVNKDSRIKYIYQNNTGSAAARNNGIRRAQGQYIALLDADDVWHKDFLEKQIAFIKKNNAVCVYCSYSKIDDNSRSILRPTISKGIITTKDMKVMNQIGCLTGLYDSSKYGKIYLKESLKSIRELADYRVLSNSTTGNKRKLIKKQYKFYREYLKENPFEAFINVIRWGMAGLRKFT